MIKAYLVGGYVRDKILGVESKDRDYTVEAPSYADMVNWIRERGKIFLEKPEYLTVRALVNGQVSDYVLARKDGAYTDGRRPDVVEPGNIIDDLSRRDFTMNAIAFDEETGEYIDPHQGRNHIKERVIVCVGDPMRRFEEDALRMLRAIRFSITKSMRLDVKIGRALRDPSLLEKLRLNISNDRKREELTKAFAFNTLQTIEMLNLYWGISMALFNTKTLWLMPTTRSN